MGQEAPTFRQMWRVIGKIEGYIRVFLLIMQAHILHVYLNHHVMFKSALSQYYVGKLFLLKPKGGLSYILRC